MNSLAIDTSDRHYSLAFDLNGLKIFINSEKDWRHAEEILPIILATMTQHNLTPKDLNKLYINIGPGSFTGLRIGIAIAKGFTLAAPETEVIPISTYEILRCRGENQVVIDAGRKEFALAIFDTNGKIITNKILSEEEFNKYKQSKENDDFTLLNSENPIRAEDLSPFINGDNIYLNYYDPQNRNLSPLYFRAPDAKLWKK
jgi:tRNA threonylcarbamoyl adenosine modification protein YeaZ